MSDYAWVVRKTWHVQGERAGFWAQSRPIPAIGSIKASGLKQTGIGHPPIYLEIGNTRA